MSQTAAQTALHHLFADDLSVAEQAVEMRKLAIGNLSAGILIEAVELFRSAMLPVDLGSASLVDLCGTGGDGAGSFNISTTASFVAAAAGTKIAKHGNVSITSQSGGIDLLRALNVHIPSDAAAASQQFDENGLCFLFAQNFHPAFKKFTAARRELAQEKIRTIFNVLGPLLNPGHANRAVMGVFAPELVEMIAEVKLQTGTQRAMVVYGNGMDELTLTGENIIAEIKDGKVLYSRKTPEDFGFARCKPVDLQGGTPTENAQITLGILGGAISGPKKDIVILNAAAAIYVGGDDVSFPDAIAQATQALQTGTALKLLNGLQA